MSEERELGEFGGGEKEDGEVEKAEREHEYSRYGLLPLEWKIEELGEVAEVVGGSTPSTSNEDYWGGDIPWATPTDITELSGPEISDTNDRITEKGLDSASTHILPPYSVLMTSRATIGECAVNTTAMATNQGFKSLIPRSGVETWYLFYRMQDIAPYLESLGSGSTFDEIIKSVVETVEIPVPSLEEQRKIASVLYNVDQAIGKTEEIIEQTIQTRQGVEQDLFTKGYYKHEDIETHRLVKAPAGWDFEQLSNHTVESAFGPRYDSEKYDEGGNIATLRTTDLDKRGNITGATMPRADLDINEFEDHLLEEGDIVVSRSGAYSGTTTKWDGYEVPTIPGAYMIRFRLRESLNPNFLRYYFNSNIGRKRLNRRKRGSGQQNLAGTDLLNMRIPIPSQGEQAEIASVIELIDEKTQFQKNYRNQLQRLKQGLMQDLLSGEVRTTDADIGVLDEVAQHG